MKRHPLTPDWPAISETLPGFDFSSWNAIVGPANMPRELVNKIAAGVAQVQKQSALIKQLGAEATYPMVMGPDALKTFIEAEVAKYVRLAKEANIQPE